MKKVIFVAVFASLVSLTGCASSEKAERQAFVDEVVRNNILNYNDNIREMEEYNARKR